MRKSLLLVAALVPIAGLAGVFSLASSAGAASIAAAPGTETIASACGGAPASAGPINLDLIPSQPVTGHQSVRAVGDDDGCGGEDGLGGREHEGAEGADD
ncbi:MAG: hypothetical protein P4M09_04730 [Devosia sp.]|nr:hypothetical protein [Devosia sp.]